jgi:chemotaxis protein MotB
MARRKREVEKIDTGRWLLTYSDMMNNLLVLFMVLYCMSLIDLSKFKALAQKFNEAFSGNAITTNVAANGPSQNADSIIAGLTSSSVSSAASQPDVSSTDEGAKQFDALYEKIKENLAARGFQNTVVVEKGNGFLTFRFGDSVMFYADSDKMKPEGNEILKYVGDTINSVNNYISAIEISGNTADMGPNTFYGFELSSNRALTVLEFLVTNCNLPDSKMTTTGNSRYKPVAGNDTESGRALNRRVDIKILRNAN